jgi:hypothetical protein
MPASAKRKAPVQCRCLRKRIQPGDENSLLLKRRFDVVEDRRDQHDVAVTGIGKRAVGLDRVAAITLHWQGARRGDADVVARPALIGAPAGKIGRDRKGVGLAIDRRRHAALESDDRDFHGPDCISERMRMLSIILRRFARRIG